MAEKLSVKRVGYSLAAVFGIVYAVCAVLVAISPDGTVKAFRYLFHGIDISKIAAMPTITGTIIGFVEIIVLGFIVGWLFAKIYNSFK